MLLGQQVVVQAWEKGGALIQAGPHCARDPCLPRHRVCRPLVMAVLRPDESGGISSRCGSGGGSPTSVVSAAHSGADDCVILIAGAAAAEDTPVCPRRAGLAGARERLPSSPEVRPQLQCRRSAHEEILLVDVDTPKVGRRNYRSQSAAHPRRRARCAAVAAVGVLLSLHFTVCAVLALREHRQRYLPTLAGPAAGEPSGIPRIIHQMYKTTELPPKWRDVPAAWAATHPAEEWTYILWTDAELRQLIAADYPWLLPTYDAYQYPTQRWDASRYAVLHKYGGLYADLDLRPERSVAPLLQGHTLLLPHTPNIGITNAVMAATPAHPFVEFALRELPRCARGGVRARGACARRRARAAACVRGCARRPLASPPISWACRLLAGATVRVRCAAAATPVRSSHLRAHSSPDAHAHLAAECAQVRARMVPHHQAQHRARVDRLHFHLGDAHALGARARRRRDRRVAQRGGLG